MDRRIYGLLGDVRVLWKGNFLVVTMCLSWAGFWNGMFFPFASVYLRFLGGSSFIIGAASATMLLVMSFVQIPGGYVCDKLGRRRILIVGNCATAVAWLVLALAYNWETYFVAMVLLALSTFGIVAESVIIMDSVPVEKRGMGFAVHGTITALAHLISPSIGGYVLENYGILGMKTILVLIGIADIVKLLAYKRWLRESLEPRRIGTVGLRGFWNVVSNSIAGTSSTIRRMLRSVIGFLIVYAIYHFVTHLVEPFWALYAIDVISLTTSQWGLITTILLGIYVCLCIPGGGLIDRYGKKPVLLAFFGANVPIISCFIYSRGYFQTLAVLGLGQTIAAISSPSWGALQADLAPKERRGQILAFFRITGALSGFSSSLIAGYLYGLNPATPFWFYVLFAAIGAFVTYLTIHEVRTS